MNNEEKSNKDISAEKDNAEDSGAQAADERKLVFDPEAAFPGSSSASSSPVARPVIEPEPADTESNSSEDDELSPLDRLLADPVLPELPRENRARLQMQSPTRLYFYWSVKHNPFKTLSRAFGSSTTSYTLVAKLLNLSRGTEEVYQVEPEGNWWFNVEPDCQYRAEVGFYAPNRPYIRIVYSNTITTPRRSPSWRTDYVPRFNVSADEFSRVLEASGYSRDAFEVALAGDDRDTADALTLGAFSDLLGKLGLDLSAFDGDELRFVLLALASGYTLEDLKGKISDALFLKLSGSGVRISAEQALAALQERFDVDTEEVTEFEEIGPAVYGLSAVHFPRRVRTRRIPTKLLNKLSKFETVSSAR